METTASNEGTLIIDELVRYLRASGPLDELSPRSNDDEVSQISREVGQLYEKLRFAIDNKEEQFFRRHAIRRALRRKSLFMHDADRICETLLLDLVRGGYLASSHVAAERKAHALAAIRSFLSLSQLLRERHELATTQRYRKFLLDVVAGALEDALYDTTKEEGVVMVMARSAEHVVRGDMVDDLSPDERRTLFYVASWRSLFAGDASLLRYKLWLLYAPHWDQGDPETYSRLAADLPTLIHSIERTIDRPLGRRILPKLHDMGIACTLLYDAVREYGAGIGAIAKDDALFSARLRVYMEKRYANDLSRAHHRSIRAIIYIFVTKSLLALGIESAYVMLLGQSLNYLAIAINVVAHPTLLFLLVGGLKKPSTKNTDRAIEMVRQITSGRPLQVVYVAPERRGILADLALGLYVSILLASLAGLTYALLFVGFHVVDIILFMLFLLLVLYFGFRIRMGAYRMRFADTKEGPVRSLVELLLLPLVSLGRYMSLKFENLNIAVIILDFVIEAPLRLVLRFFDAFSSFVTEKREEIYAP